MADVSWTKPLLPDQRPNPVVYFTEVDLPKTVLIPEDEQLEKIFIRGKEWNAAAH